MAEGDRTPGCECPVCHENYLQPKLLPCAHTVCRKCVLSWLRAEGQGGCPLCRTPILPTDPLGQSDVTVLVDKLPTDLATKAMVESKNALNGDHVCNICDVDIPATSFCLDCDVKLCGLCAKVHGKLPATRDHVLEELKTLTAERLAASRKPPCDSHPDRPAELYCPQHHALLCVKCFSSCHCACTEVKDIDRAAAEERKSLTEHVRRLRDKDAALAERVTHNQQEIRDAQAHFNSMKSQVKATYDRLQQKVEARRQEMTTLLQEQEEQFVTPRVEENASMEKERTNINGNAHAVEMLVSNSGDGALFGMLTKLRARLTDLEKRAKLQDKHSVILSSVCFDSKLSDSIEHSIAEFGQLTDAMEITSASDDDQVSEAQVSSAGGPHQALAAAPSVASATAASTNTAVSVGAPTAQPGECRQCPVTDILAGLASGPLPQFAEAYSQFAAKAADNAATCVTSHRDENNQAPSTSEALDLGRNASRSSSSSSDVFVADRLPSADGVQSPTTDHPASSAASRRQDHGVAFAHTALGRRHTVPPDVFSSDYVSEWTPPERPLGATGGTTRSSRHGLPAADRVRRGPDWNSLFLENLDGSPPGLGTVIQVGVGPRARGRGWVNVRWDATGTSRWYRMGAEDCYDVKLV